MTLHPPPSAGAKQSPERFYRTARLVSGLILMAFVTMHLSNVALNLFSIEVADAGLKWLTAPWRSPPVTVLLYGAAAVHILLVLRSLYLKRTLRMRA
jgi:adenylate cyclase